MTDSPRTLAFNSVEWRDLCIHNAERLAKSLERFDRPTEDDVASVAEQLDRMKLFMVAWSRSQKPQGETSLTVGEWRALNRANPPVATIYDTVPMTREEMATVIAPRKRGRPRKIPVDGVQHQ